MGRRITLVRAVVLLVAGTGAALPAAAGDGRIEINQTCAVQSGCGPGDAPGFPVTIGSVNPSYVLTSSISVGTEGISAIVAQGIGITIDLNGFTIQGGYFCGTSPPDCIVNGGAFAIDAPGSRNTVRNGKVHRFSAGGVSVGHSGRVEDLDVDLIGGDGIRAGLGSTVRNNQISNLRGDGIELVATGQSAGDGLVEGNLVRSARGDGIVVESTLVLSNSVRNSTGAARLGVGSAYGLNRFERLPVGGTSLGNNACGNTRC